MHLIIYQEKENFLDGLYIFLFYLSFFLPVTLYILFFIGVTNPQTRLVTISNITPSLFNQLRLDYGETLSCPCTTIAVPYETFVSTTISFDPVCSSIFVSREWIEALYLPYASTFLVMDFRTTGSSQVRESFSLQDIFYPYQIKNS